MYIHNKSTTWTQHHIRSVKECNVHSRSLRKTFTTGQHFMYILYVRHIWTDWTSQIRHG